MSTIPERFGRDGYCRGTTILEGSELEDARDAVERILSGTCARSSELLLFRRERLDDPKSQVHVIGAWLAEDALRKLVFLPEVVEMVCRLMNSDTIRLFQDQLFVKMPFSTGEVPWHQDYSNWTHTTPPSHITCWIALDDATLESGCLHYVPGSHKGPLLPKIARQDDMTSAFLRLPEETRQDFIPVAVPVNTGTGVFHHCLTIHGTHANATAQPRRAYAITYMHPATRSATGDRPVLPKGPVVSPGSLVEGDLFPMIRG